MYEITTGKLTISERILRYLKTHVPIALIDNTRPTREALNLDSWVLRERLHWWVRKPTTLNDKIGRKMVYDRRPLISTFADKWTVREYVNDRVGPSILNEVYQIATDPRDIDFVTLPDRFVIKPTHSSGAVIIVHDQADITSELPDPHTVDGSKRSITWIRKEHVDRRHFIRLCNYWLSLRYSPREWAYSEIKPRIIVERFLENSTGASPTDYKFFVFHGKASWIQVDIDRSTTHMRSLHWPDWTQIPVNYNYPRPSTPPEPPASFAEMMAIAETLGAETDMVRVDLYEVDGKVIFGELTNYPEGGTGQFDPPRYNRILGEGWSPPLRYR